MKKQDKIFTVQNLAAKLKEAKSIVLTDYRGLTVSQMGQLRTAVKQAGGDLTVVKNTLLNRALSSLQLPVSSFQLEGPTAIVAAYQDELAPLKAVYNFAQGAGMPALKSGIWESRVLTKEDLERLGSLPEKNELLFNLIKILSSPTLHFVQVLAGNQQKLILILKQSKPSFARQSRATEGKGGEN